MTSYNYESFSPDNYDLASADGPDVGQKAPDFQLETPDGEMRNLLDFEGECLVLELGSMTCPLFLTRHDSMQKIASDYPNAAHAVLYVREAHPGAAIPAHKSMDDKKAVASILKTELYDLRTILVDGVGGEAHLAYGSMPNAVYIIDGKGIVRFKAPWNNSATTRRALDAVLQNKPADFKSYFKPAKPGIVLSTAKRAGKGSAKDFFHGLPRLIWNVLIKNNLRTFLGRS
ncbi:deiodinase-like protein [Dinoroseobacter sp. S375]|uniref:deiodinase-like protein n=1 Tax=Dinoroseobacter sp. S375 TaxID=3415136 RepID=UPI003C7DC77A